MRISDWSSDVCSSDLHAERAVEVEDVGADRLAGGVGEADAREAEGVLERPVHQHPPERVEQPVAKGDRPAVENARSEERSVGKECVSTGRSRWSAYH